MANWVFVFRWSVCCLPLLAAVAACDNQTGATRNPAADPPSQSNNAENEAPDANPANLDENPDATTDEKHRRLAVGTWTDEYQGHRTLTLRSDGTGTMVVELEGLAATLYAERLTFEEEWEITDGRLTMKAISGKPEAQANLVLSTMGDSADHEILELTDNRMLLLDADGKTNYDWQRADAP